MFGQTQETLFLFGADAQFGQLRQAAGLAQQAQDDGFAPRARQGRDAQVHFLARDADRLASVLRQAAFADVHAAEQLDARAYRVEVRARCAAGRGQHPVDPHTDQKAILVRLDVNVGGATRQGLGEDGVDEVDGRRFLRQFTQAGGVGSGSTDTGIQRGRVITAEILRQGLDQRTLGQQENDRLRRGLGDPLG
ncbi:hypothetical protein D3C85_1056030 [compost metagenome]